MIEGRLAKAIASMLTNPVMNSDTLYENLLKKYGTSPRRAFTGRRVKKMEIMGTGTYFTVGLKESELLVRTQEFQLK